MDWDVAGLGNALMDALVVIEDDGLVTELGLARGTMNPVDHDGWQAAFDRVQSLGIAFDSGGSCANSIATLGLLGARTLFCGQVGTDELGALYATKLDEACGGHALRTTETVRTGKCLSIISSHDAERTMVTDLGAAVTIDALGGFAGDLERARFGHFEGYMLLGPESRELVIEGMKQTVKGGGKVALDVSDPFVVLQTRDMMRTLIDDFVDLVFLNEEESLALSGAETAEEALIEIAENLEVETVVVKLGGRGSIVHHHGETTRIPARMVNAVDTTGAGDAYAGGFLYGIVNGWSIEQAGHLASAVAAQTVTQVGAVVKDREVLGRLVRECAPSA